MSSPIPPRFGAPPATSPASIVPPRLDANSGGTGIVPTGAEAIQEQQAAAPGETHQIQAQNGRLAAVGQLIDATNQQQKELQQKHDHQGAIGRAVEGADNGLNYHDSYNNLHERITQTQKEAGNLAYQIPDGGTDFNHTYNHISGVDFDPNNPIVTKDDPRRKEGWGGELGDNAQGIKNYDKHQKDGSIAFGMFLAPGGYATGGTTSNAMEDNTRTDGTHDFTAKDYLKSLGIAAAGFAVGFVPGVGGAIQGATRAVGDVASTVIPGASRLGSEGGTIGSRFADTVSQGFTNDIQGFKNFFNNPKQLFQFGDARPNGGSLETPTSRGTSSTDVAPAPLTPAQNTDALALAREMWSNGQTVAPRTGDIASAPLNTDAVAIAREMWQNGQTVAPGSAAGTKQPGFFQNLFNRGRTDVAPAPLTPAQNTDTLALAREMWQNGQTVAPRTGDIAPAPLNTDAVAIAREMWQNGQTVAPGSAAGTKQPGFFQNLFNRGRTDVAPAPLTPAQNTDALALAREMWQNGQTVAPRTGNVGSDTASTISDFESFMNEARSADGVSGRSSGSSSFSDGLSSRSSTSSIAPSAPSKFTQWVSNTWNKLLQSGRNFSARGRGDVAPAPLTPTQNADALAMAREMWSNGQNVVPRTGDGTMSPADANTIRMILKDGEASPNADPRFVTESILSSGSTTGSTTPTLEERLSVIRAQVQDIQAEKSPNPVLDQGSRVPSGGNPQLNVSQNAEALKLALQQWKDNPTRALSFGDSSGRSSIDSSGTVTPFDNETLTNTALNTGSTPEEVLKRLRAQQNETITPPPEKTITPPEDPLEAAVRQAKVEADLNRNAAQLSEAPQKTVSQLANEGNKDSLDILNESTLKKGFNEDPVNTWGGIEHKLDAKGNLTPEAEKAYEANIGSWQRLANRYEDWSQNLTKDQWLTLNPEKAKLKPVTQDTLFNQAKSSTYPAYAARAKTIIQNIEQSRWQEFDTSLNR